MSENIKYRAAEFEINIPTATVDVTSYCFSFPDLGSFPPNLVIRSQILEPGTELETVIDEMVNNLSNATENLTESGKASGKRGASDYAVRTFEWGPDGSRMTQRCVMLSSGEPQGKLFVFLATDNAENFSRSESVFNEIIASFEFRSDSN